MIKNILKKILLLPYNIIKKLLSFVVPGSKPKKQKKESLIDIFERFFDKYDEKIMLRLNLDEKGDSLEIYSSNFKTTLKQAKKSKKGETIEAEIIEKE